MAVHQTVPRRWAPHEVDLVRHVAGRCWESIERARVERTLRASEERLRAVFADQVAGMVRGLLGEGPGTVVRAGLLSTQLLGVALTRYVLRLPPIVAMAPDEIVGWIAPTLQRYLTGAGG